MVSLTTPDHAALLAAYDASLRAEAEMLGAGRTARLGPLWLGWFGEGQGFVSYRSLDGVEDLPALIDAAVKGFCAPGADGEAVNQIEWKTRSHDAAPGLEEALAAAGFEADEEESVMVGAASGLVGVPTPEGVEIVEITDEEALWRALRMQDLVFGSEMAARMAPEILGRWARGERLRVFAALVDGHVVSAGRIDPVPGTDFAGIWGGATLPEFRGRGIYRALTARRVEAVASDGVRWVHSDSTDDSRPILERAGLVRVTGTTPWIKSVG